MRIFRQHIAVAAGEHDGQAGIALANDAGEFDAVHPGHDDIGEHQIGGKFVLGEDRKRGVGIVGPANGVSQILQQLGGELPDIVIVFDHKDTIAASGGGGLAVGGSGFRRIVRHGRLRQIDGESRALSGCAGDLDVATGLLGKAERLAEAEAGSLADLLGREERLEDRVDMIGRNAGAGVGNGDGDEVAAARGLGAQGRDGVNFLDCDCQQAFLVHGIAAVYGEIDQRGLELRDVGNCEAIDIGDIDLDPDPGADQRTNKPRHAFYLRADIEYLRFEWLPAGKRQQLSGQFRCPFHGLGNRIDIAAPAILRQIMSAKEVGRGKDDGQEIVEVMRHAAGELAHGFHLLRLT